MSDKRRHEAYLRLDSALRYREAARLELAVRARLRELAGRLLCADDGGDDFAREAAALLGRLVAARELSEETADLLWLEIAACAAVRRFTSRPAAEASIS